METPPRTWGRRQLTGLYVLEFGNTPTHVGKTYTLLFFDFCLSKHPHARGEDNRYLPNEEQHRETPPRTWGRPLGAAFGLVGGRNTPTHVGKTWEGDPLLVAQGKHPHARGEDSRTGLPLKPSGETPPRTWGRPSHHPHEERCRRNTPTHVGKTDFRALGRRSMGKHPHARGEDPHGR